MIHSLVIAVLSRALRHTQRNAVRMVKALVLLVTATPYLIPLYPF